MSGLSHTHAVWLSPSSYTPPLQQGCVYCLTNIPPTLVIIIFIALVLFFASISVTPILSVIIAHHLQQCRGRHITVGQCHCEVCECVRNEWIGPDTRSLFGTIILHSSMSTGLRVLSYQYYPQSSSSAFSSYWSSSSPPSP